MTIEDEYFLAAESLSKEIDFGVMCSVLEDHTLVKMDFNDYLDHKQEVIEWVAANCPDNINTSNKWLFKHKKDAIMFALRWA